MVGRGSLVLQSFIFKSTFSEMAMVHRRLRVNNGLSIGLSVCKNGSS